MDAAVYLLLGIALAVFMSAGNLVWWTGSVRRSPATAGVVLVGYLVIIVAGTAMLGISLLFLIPTVLNFSDGPYHPPFLLIATVWGGAALLPPLWFAFVGWRWPAGARLDPRRLRSPQPFR